MIVFVLSSFLDNIAAALIGGVMAREVFRGKVHIGYLAAIVAASNAGGAGSVVGDTTTTMMWIAGVSPLVGARGLRGGVRRHLHLRHPGRAPAAAILADHEGHAAGHADRLERASPSSFAILIAAILANVIANLRFPALLDALPGDRRSRSGSCPAGHGAVRKRPTGR